MNASIRAQHKHETAMKAVRMNGKITKVKQPQDQPNSKMGDHLGSINLNYEKNQVEKPEITTKKLIGLREFEGTYRKKWK